jgi:hypothetical protein
VISLGMKRPRFNGRRGPGITTRSRTTRDSRWTQVPEPGPLKGFNTSGRKRVFAIVTRSIHTEDNGQTGRRILIFDNHPATLRLLDNLDEIDFGPRRRKPWRYAVISIVLAVILLLGMLGSLLQSKFESGHRRTDAVLGSPVNRSERGSLPNGVAQITSPAAGVNLTSAQ